MTFLALLELIRLKVVRAVQHDRFGPIQLDLAVADLAEARELARDIGDAGGWRVWRWRMGENLAIELEPER